MKKIFSTFTIWISSPLKILKKLKFDTFLGGLIIGALFSMVVNVVTVKIQEEVSKQRILEAVENEILNNTLTASNIAVQDKETIDAKKTYNPFYFIRRYSRDLWEQSSEPLQFVAQLDQETQIAVSGYYTVTLPFNNGMLDRLEKLTETHLEDCAPIGNNLAVSQKELCSTWNEILLDSERSTAVSVANSGFKVLQKFHPTKDRLNNWFLKLLMGSESTRVLSGK